MQANYTDFIARVINKYEGNYGWDKGDPGGPTKYGVTCFDLAEHRRQKMTSMTAWAPIVKAMPLAEAEVIYDQKYARQLFFSQLRSGPDCFILDYGINSGIGRPLTVAKRILKLDVKTDSKLLIDAINAAHGADPKWFVDAMAQERLHFMHQIRGGAAWSQFGKGWGARVSDLDAYCDHLAVGSPAPTPPAAPTVIHPKVTHGDPTSSTKSVTKTLGGGATAAGAAHTSGAPHWVLPVIGAAAVVAAVGFVLYEKRAVAAANALVVIPPTVPPMPAVVAQVVAQTTAGALHA